MAALLLSAFALTNCNSNTSESYSKSNQPVAFVDKLDTIAIKMGVSELSPSRAWSNDLRKQGINPVEVDYDFDNGTTESSVNIVFWKVRDKHFMKGFYLIWDSDSLGKNRLHPRYTGNIMINKDILSNYERWSLDTLDLTNIYESDFVMDAYAASHDFSYYLYRIEESDGKLERIVHEIRSSAVIGSPKGSHPFIEWLKLVDVKRQDLMRHIRK